MQLAWLNGEWTPLEAARISPLDRGFLFGDGVYEVIPVYRRRLFAFGPHLERLRHSLHATGIANPHTDEEWRQLCETLVERHPWDDQFIYLQVTRGVQPKRDHLPDDCLVPTVFAYTNELKPVSEAILRKGIHCITAEDIRWRRCDIKAITLLPNVMLKMQARAAGADDAILIRDGLVSEGTASNVMIVEGDRLSTPPLDHALLGGITRQILLQVARDAGLEVREEAITEQRLAQADEIWLTSSTKEALPVAMLNGQPVGTGRPGPVWQRLRQAFHAAREQWMEQNHE